MNDTINNDNNSEYICTSEYLVNHTNNVDSRIKLNEIKCNFNNICILNIPLNITDEMIESMLQLEKV